ncbi:MAG: 16S rRNA processing protein RimM [Epsilonproteobacteria bacterium]|nr:16S rRNA processing protein RimM [Campylobacterota bacterium]NPA56465.1 16S rRNA processing protein RimM [Campylobacterota bacterium]
MSRRLTVARLGRTVGLKGEMRLHLFTDFPEQFQKGTRFQSDRGELTVEYYNPQRGVIKFVGINRVEEAKPYTNAFLYRDEEETRASIPLEEGEYFWFDILGSSIYENGELLGKVRDIQRLPSADYLVIETSEELRRNFPKSFLLPYQDPFIQEVNIEEKRISVKGAKDILEAS